MCVTQVLGDEVCGPTLMTNISPALIYRASQVRLAKVLQRAFDGLIGACGGKLYDSCQNVSQYADRPGSGRDWV